MRYYKGADEIQESLLSYMGDEYNKEKGSWLWEMLKAVACALSDFTAELDEAADKLFVKALQGEELDDYVENWSYVERKGLTRATGYVTFTAKEGKKGLIPQGTYVSGSGCTYITSEDCEIEEEGGEVTVAVAASEYGSVGNTSAGNIDRMLTQIEIIKSVTNRNDITGGEDEESDDELRERYSRAIKKAANAGNMAFYEELATSVEGISEAYCVPCPDNVGGSADVYVINSDGGTVTEEAIKQAQKLIDPNQNGDGGGEAPVGAVVTVKNPSITQVNVQFTAIYHTGYNKERVEKEVRERINTYFRECFSEKILRYNKVGQCILESEGIKDFKDLRVNSAELNIEPQDGVCIFTLGELIINA